MFRDGHCFMKDTINVSAGEVSSIVKNIHHALSRQPDIFQFNETLVRINSHNGLSKIYIVDKNWLYNRYSDAISFTKTKKGGEIFLTDAKKIYADILLSMPGEWIFNRLNGVSDIPMIDATGRIVNSNGYDKSTGYYLSIPKEYNFAEKSFTLEEAKSAFKKLCEPVKDFPFDSDTDRSIFVAMILTFFTSHFIKNKPIFGISANTPGTGKSMLADLVSIICTGNSSAPITWSINDEESEKRLSSKILCGERIILIDNLVRPLTSEVLCTYATQELISLRILGKSETKNVNTSPMIITTGNNLTFSGDLIRRSLSCTLVSKCEQPENIIFDLDPKSFCKYHRADLVSAALTILSAYIGAGSPKQNLAAYGSFQAWSDLVRSSLVWLVQPDPNLVIQKIRNKDPELEKLETVLTLWNLAFGTKPMKVVQILTSFDPSLMPYPSERAELLNVVNSITRDKDPHTKLGIYLNENEGRAVNGLKLKKGAKSLGSYSWSVVSSINEG